MKNLVTKIENYNDLTNDLTRELDSLLIAEEKKYLKYGQNYIFKTPDVLDNGNNVYAIRYPGATRGSIVVDKDMIIQKVEIYEDDYHTDIIYEPNVRDYLDKYIGMKLEII